jgi:low affinity Fe/Cu permease
MARRQSNGGKSAANGKGKARAEALHSLAASGLQTNELFGRFAHAISKLAGKPATFCVALLLIAGWAASGPLFDYSDTWQLMINTTTTIVTFLMVFVIQNTQNRDGMAVQLKLAELIIAAHGAKNAMAIAEDMTEEELEQLHERYRSQADATFQSLERKRAAKSKK